MDTFIQIANLLLTFSIGIILTIYLYRQRSRKEQKNNLSELYLQLKAKIYPYLWMLDNERDDYIVNSVFHHLNHSIRLESMESYDYWHQKREVLVDIEKNIKSEFLVSEKEEQVKLITIGDSLDSILFKLNKSEQGTIGDMSFELLSMLSDYRSSMLKEYYKSYDFSEFESIITAHRKEFIEDFEAEKEILNFITTKRAFTLEIGRDKRLKIGDKTKELLDLIKEKILNK